ncbi:lysostaphin-like isoform X1 [Homarus americanus]|uniref:Cuticle protein 6-like 8 n=1 Tax=Homarus americanus TaxID=6706 RepID=A0A8J5NC94_HOMAM|nr:lysostaphin-like isoform X1 [Homarus americanus]KAG7176578.1 Cuticle protein 6-like 8 [Homarus americanus]
MNALVVISACICAAAGRPQYYPYTAGYIADPYAAVAPYVASPIQYTLDYNVVPDAAQVPEAYAGQYVVAPPAIPTEYKSQHHSQDEFGQYAFGHVSHDQAHSAVRDYTGAVRGSYTYIDTNGEEVVAHYTADQNGFRVSSNALPVAPVFDGEAPVALQFELEAPVFNLEQVAETPEVMEARAEHFRLVEEHKAAVAAALAAATAEEATEAPEEETAEAAVEEETAEAPVEEETAEAPVEEETAEAPVEEETAEAPVEEETAEASVEEETAEAEAPEETTETPVEEEVAAAESRRKRQVLIGNHFVFPEFYKSLPIEPVVVEPKTVVEGAVGTAALRDAELLRIINTPNHAVSYRVL